MNTTIFFVTQSLQHSVQARGRTQTHTQREVAMLLCCGPTDAFHMCYFYRTPRCNCRQLQKKKLKPVSEKYILELTTNSVGPSLIILQEVRIYLHGHTIYKMIHVIVSLQLESLTQKKNFDLIYIPGTSLP